MKHKRNLGGHVLSILAVLAAVGPSVVSARPGTALPQVMRTDLGRLEETWNILDQFASRIWPGWTGYRDVPFLFSYPNGVEMLVGHPNPPDDFTAVDGIEVQGKKVYLNRKREIRLDMKPPYLGGGGPNPFGKGQPVQTVQLNIREAQTEVSDPFHQTGKPRPLEHLVSGEVQILINLHELFHVFQNSVYEWRFGNLQYNTDTNYAVYAEVEGLALEKAALESDEKKAREYLEDFLIARERKRAGMNEDEGNQESEEDLVEGTAVFAEIRALELIREGYRPRLSSEIDPHFLKFKNLDLLLDDRMELLRKTRALTLDARSKCYRAGSFQALLLTRLFPEWQDNYFASGGLLDRTIAERLNLTPEKKAAVLGRLKDRYGIDALEKKHGLIIGKRDEALNLFQNRAGRHYIVSFKPTGEFLDLKGRGEIYDVGLMRLCPKGVENFKIRDVVFEGAESPLMQDQLYYLKWVDPDGRAGDKGYSLTFARREGEDIFYDAEFKTKGFVLRAPKIRLQDTPARVKVTVLEKVKAGN